METNQKQLIANEVAQLADKLSQNKVAVKAGVSAATINHVINTKWDMIKDDIWHKIQSSLRIELDWIHADTANYVNFINLLHGAKTNSLSIAISMKEGRSKSHSYKRFERLNDNVIYVECKNYWTKKTFVQALLKAAGLSPEGKGTVGEMIEYFIDHVRTLKKPIIIIDQFDKLKDPQRDLFMDFYNDLEGRCAFVLSGVPALAKSILRGVQRDKIGYREMYSRIGRTFIAFPELSLEDVTAICNANGVNDDDLIVEIHNQCDGDMRRVRRLIERAKLSKRVA